MRPADWRIARRPPAMREDKDTAASGQGTPSPHRLHRSFAAVLPMPATRAAGPASTCSRSCVELAATRTATDHA